MKIFNAEVVLYNGRRYLGLQAPFTQIEQWLSANADKFPNDFDIKLVRRKRSRDANAYMWQLADKIASAIGVTKEDVYRSHIHDVGVFDDLMISKNATEHFINGWNDRGIGWFAEVIDNYGESHSIVRVYYGSSTYDTKQMSRLIDNMVQEAKSLSEHGVYIETLTPDEMARMMASWGK